MKKNLLPGAAPLVGRSAPARATRRWLLAAAVLLPALGHAQVNLYTFAQSAGTYTPITGGTVAGTALAGSNFSLDDSNFTLAAGTIPFTFTFNGVGYTGLRINTNGYITFGTTAPGVSGYTPISATTGYAGAAAAIGHDLVGDATAGNLGQIRYETVGTAPNRSFVIQYSNFKRYISSIQTDNLNFQIRLNETSNTINFVYNTPTVANTSTGLAQVGLRGASNAVYNNRTTTTDWSASTAGTVNTATMTLSNTVKPASGLTYTFTPPPPCTGTPANGTAVASVATICSGSTTISLSGGTTGVSGLSYQLQSSPTGTSTYTNVGAASTTSSTFTVSPAVSTDYRIVTTCTNSTLTGTSSVATVTYNSAIPPYASLPVTQNFESWISRCNNSEIPGANWRATPVTGDNSWRRNDQGHSTGGWRFINDEPAPYAITSSQGSYSARFHSFGTAAGGTGSLDLFVDLSAAGTKTLTFDYYNASGADNLAVQLSEDGGGTFPTTLLTLGTSAAFNGQSVVISSTSATAVIRFKATSDFGADDIGIDKLQLGLTPACAAVAFGTTTAITQNSATVSFAAAAGGTSYSLTYSPGGATPQTVSPGAVNLTSLQPYTLYTVTVTTDCGGGQTNTATTSFRTAIGNDECSGAVALTPGAAGAACSAQTYTLNGATNSTGVTNACAAPVGGDVWFSFVASGANHSITVLPTFDLDAVIDLRSSTGGCPGTSLLCQNASTSGGGTGTETLTATGLTTGATYYVRVYSTFASTSYNFDICITTPPNVPCAQVTNAAVTTATGTATASTGELTFTAASGATNYFLTLAPTAGGTTSSATISGSPVSLTGLTPNTSYTITITTNCSNGGVSNPVSVVFTSAAAPAAPSNDDCAGATPITSIGVGSCGTAVAGTNVGATASSTTGTPAPGCASYLGGDVWYSLTVPANGIVQVETSQGSGTSISDTGMALYSGSCGALTLLNCNDDIVSGTNNFSRVRVTGQTPGATIYARVWEYGNDTFGSFSICAQTDAPVTSLVVNAGNSPYSASGTFNNVTIESGGTANLSADLTVNGTLTINDGGTLNTVSSSVLGAGNFVLQAGGTLSTRSTAGITASSTTAGAIRNSGTTRTYSNDANYVYNGTAAQVTGSGLPATVRSLTVNNSTGLTLSQALSVRQLARLQSGNLATGGNAFTLLSVAGQGTALIDNTGGVVTGTGTMQRAIDATNPAGIGYRHYAAPVTNTTVADLAAGAFSPVVNPAYNSAAQPGFVTPFPTVFGYDETRIASVTNNFSDFNRGWVSPTAASDAMVSGKGYTVNIPDATLVDFTGTFKSGASNNTGLTRGPSADAGWHLLGNPYPSPLDWDLVDNAPATSLPGMDNAMYVFQSTGQYTGTYRSYVNGVGASSLIDAGSGFFVRVAATGAPGSVNLTNAHRVTTFGPQPAFGRSNDVRPLLTLNLSGNGQQDETTVYFEAGATAGPDSQFDAVKRLNMGAMSLGTVLNNQEFAINGLAPLTSLDVVVPLTVSDALAGTYTFGAPALRNFGSTAVYLRDAATGTQTLLSQGTRYQFTLAANAGPGRFSLLFRPTGVTGTRNGFEAAQVLLYPNPAHGAFTLSVPAVANARSVQATLLNALGQQVSTRSLPLGSTGTVAEFSTASLAAGVYVLQLRAGEQVVTKRVVVE